MLHTARQVLSTSAEAQNSEDLKIRYVHSQLMVEVVLALLAAAAKISALKKVKVTSFQINWASGDLDYTGHTAWSHFMFMTTKLPPTLHRDEDV